MIGPRTQVVILLAGLPGCGKTTLLCQMRRDGWLVFDDFKANAFDNSSEFRKSRKFRTLMAALSDGLRCVVADIDFCKTESRAEAQRVLMTDTPDVKIDWRFFANDLVACEANIRHRNRASIRQDLTKLHEYSAVYRIPQRAYVLPIGGNQT